MRMYLAAANVLLLVFIHCNASSASKGREEHLDSSFIPILASGKRQHNIMRFGKRPSPGHSLIHFGKRPDSSSSLPNLLDYFQQQKNRDNSYKRGHSIMRFGKRNNDYYYSEDKRANTGHSMMYFGKRGNKAGHSMMYFGKRNPNGHSMMYFGKRDDVFLYPVVDDEEEKRAAHSMIHFGKRDNDKRSHAMIHFGKRESEEGYDDESDEEMVKRQHNLLRFGKKNDRKGSHAMIHFGKRDLEEDKRAYAMIHLGKRSDEEGVIVLGNQSESQGGRKKRESGSFPNTLIHYENADDFPTMEKVREPIFYDPNAEAEDWDPNSTEFSDQLDKKDSGKNAFLRFG